MTPTAMQTLITSVGSVVTAAIGWMSSFVGEITSKPLLLLFAAVPLVGLGVGLLRRMLNVN